MATTYEVRDGKLVEVVVPEVVAVEEGPWTLEQINSVIASHQAEVDKWTARKVKALELGVVLVADVPQEPQPVEGDPQPV